AVGLEVAAESGYCPTWDRAYMARALQAREIQENRRSAPPISAEVSHVGQRFAKPTRVSLRPEQVLASRLMPELTAAREKQLGELVRTARLTGEVPTIGAVAGINPSSEPLLIRGRLAWAAAIEAAIPRVAVDLIRDDGAYQLVG